MSSIYNKMFIDGEWNIAYRKRVVNDNKEIFSYVGFSSLPKDKSYWFADPIVFKTDDKNYLFCEAYDRKNWKGNLGVFEIKEGICTNFKIIINENYHLSYPFVFKYDLKFYMIPESGENKTMDLYEAIEFPYRWKKVCTLSSGIDLADPTVFIKDDKVFIFAYETGLKEWRGNIYELNMDSYKITKISQCVYAKNIGRPAGGFFKSGNKIIRPCQDCNISYGKSMSFNEIIFEGDSFTEKELLHINSADVIVDGKMGVDRIHTYTATSDYEFIDYAVEKFDLFKRFKILKRIRARKKRGKKL